MIRNAAMSAIAWSSVDDSRASVEEMRGTVATHDARRRIGIASAGTTPSGNASPAGSPSTSGSTVKLMTVLARAGSTMFQRKLRAATSTASGRGELQILLAELSSAAVTISQ